MVMPRTILVVDDESDVEILLRQRFRHAIREGEFRFVFAFDGEDALEQLRRQPDIELMLADINMPGLDGLTLLGRMPEVAPQVRTIIVSAYGDMANIRTAMNRGAYDFLIKPIDMVDLEATIRRVLEIRPATRSGGNAADTLQQAGTLLHEGPVGVAVAGPDGRIRYVNRCVVEWSGVGAEQLVGASVVSLFARPVDLDAAAGDAGLEVELRCGARTVPGTLRVGMGDWFGVPARVLWLHAVAEER